MLYWFFVAIFRIYKEMVVMNNVEVGKRLKTARIVNGFKLEEAATKVNISKGSLSRYESGNRSTNIEILNDLSSLYRVQPEFFVSGTLQLYGAGQSYIDFNTGEMKVITEEEEIIAQKILSEKIKTYIVGLLEKASPQLSSSLMNLKLEHFQVLAHILEKSERLSDSLEELLNVGESELDQLANIINGLNK